MGEVVIEVKEPGEGEPDFMAIPFPEGSTEGGFSNGAREVDGQLQGRLQRLVDSGELRSDLGTTVVLHTDGELGARRVVVAGVGKKDEIDADALRTAASAVAHRMADVGGTLGWLLDDSLPLSLDEQARAVVEGAMLGSYSPARWKTEERPAAPIEKIVLYTPAGNGLAESAGRIATVAKWVNFARDLANSPPNELTPEVQDMKGDMAGGAAAIAAVAAVAELELPVRIVAVVAAAENLVSGDSFRPGDILRAANGKTIEITNTDAEGRLVLADALWYARREGATHLLDLATLTGAMEFALGDFYAGLFANEEGWLEEVLAAAKTSGDHAWPFPLHPRYRRYVDSFFADLKNSSDLRQGSPVLAAEFLREFSGDGPWAHIDMAGPGFLERSRGDYLTQRGGTGYGVRLIVELAQRLSS